MPSLLTINSKSAATRPHSSTRRAQSATRLNKTARSSRGFTLVETMAALTILAFGVLGVAAGLVTAMKVSMQSRASTEAIYLVEQQLETLRSLPLTAIEAAGGGAVINDPDNPIDPLDDSAMQYTRSWTIDLDTPQPNVILITVTVDWVDERGTNRTASMNTLRASS